MKKYLLLAFILISTRLMAQNTFPASGNVGIGTTNPTHPLTIPITSNGMGISLGYYYSLSAGQFTFIGQTGLDGTFNGGNLTGGDNGSTGMAIIHTSGGAGNSAELAFVTHNNGSDSRERVRIDRLGNVGIGTTSPSEKLSVNGNIRSKKLIITQTDWSDYVFDSSYQLKPLTEVEQFIKTNKHLPDVPSAKQVEKEGIDVGDNQALLLKKIEELTLYMIIQQKQIKEIEKTNEVQQKENELLKQRIKKLENEK